VELHARVARLESRLRETEALLDGVLASSLTGIMVFKSLRDATGTVVDFEWSLVNPTGLQGRPPGELPGRRLSEVYPESWPLGLFDRYARVVETGSPDAFEQQYERDGQPRWIRASLVKLGDGFVINYFDVTDTRQTHKALRQTEQLADKIFDLSPVAVQIYDPDGTSRRLNEAQRRLLGLPSTQYGVGIFNVLADPMAQEYGISDRFRQALAGEVVETSDQVVELGDPRNIWDTDNRRVVFNEVFFPIHDDHGTVSAVVAMAWDNTARAEAERTLRQLAHAQSDFISTVSHELRTPLTSLRGALSLLSGGPFSLPESVRPLLDIALRNSERLLALINDLLDIQGIESGRLEMNPQEVDLARLVTDSLAENQAFAAQLGVALELVHAEPGLWVTGDPNRLLQLMANLLSNAAKFSPPEGVVEVSVKRHGSSARICVLDHGPGIPEEFRPRVFHRFAQADSSASRLKGGTGLGLSISKALVESMGGRIGFVTETEGAKRGTAFHVDLPLIVPPTGSEGSHGFPP
jgi:signal transduction histidine kinase